jgi:hypothetical protein
MPRSYWLDLFTGTTWNEFLKAGANVSGFRESRWKTVQKMQRGDYLLCYLTGLSRFIGVLEVTSGAFKSQERIWHDQLFPCRVKVEPVVMLTPDTAVPVHNFRQSLTCFTKPKDPNAWGAYFRGSPAKWSTRDGEIVLAALKHAKDNPIVLPVDKRKLARKPPIFIAEDDVVVTVPEDERTDDTPKAPSEVAAVTEHTRIQAALLKLGSEMAFDVWVARNDRSKIYEGVRLDAFPKCRSTLPLPFDEATNKTIELIDVLWLRGNTIVAAFEIESTTSVYSGLLRMSDLMAMQPNLNIPLYLVAPEDRRDKVLAEINRPTFARLQPPLSEVCRFISFSELKTRLQDVGGYVKYMKPEFLDELSETCILQEV